MSEFVSILEDESGVCGLPVRFSSAAILFSVLMVLCAFSLAGFLEGAESSRITADVSGISAAAEQLFLRGEGSVLTLELEVPQDAAVVFGALPGKEVQWPEAADNYYITLGGRSRFFAANACFSNSGLDGPAVLGPGKHRLLLLSRRELASGKLFIAISEDGGI